MSEYNLSPKTSLRNADLMVSVLKCPGKWLHLCLFHKPVAVTLIRPIGFFDVESGLFRPEL